MLRTMLLAGAALIALGALSGPANALCRDDIETLRARLVHQPQKAPNVTAANAQLAKAEEQEPYDEGACHNAIVRAWRAFKTPAPEEAQPVYEQPFHQPWREPPPW